MKVKEINAGLLCNFEVMDLLRYRGASQEDVASFVTVLPSECKVYNYLSQTPAGTQSCDALRDFFRQIDKYKLTKAEQLQVANLRPATPVEVHLIVEDIEERMTADTIDQLLTTVDSLPKPPEKSEDEEQQVQEGGDAEDDEEQEDGNADEQEGEEMDEQ